MLSEKHFGEYGTIYRWWNSPKIGVPLWVISAGITIHWIFAVPTPGKAIGALAVVAGIMSVREMKILGKVSWVALLICMLVTEFRAIDEDHTDNTEKQKQFFDAQKAGFSSVTTQAQNDFSATTKGLETAIQGLNTNIEIANRTFHQTVPRAQLESTSFRLPNAPIPPENFKSGVDYEFDFQFANNGSRPGSLEKELGEIYVGKPDNLEDQKTIDSKFESDWREKAVRVTPPQPISPNGPHYWTEHRTLTDLEVGKLLHEGNTIYAVSRMEYSDSTGKWWSDHCEHFQFANNTLWIQVLHPCLLLNNDRYPARGR